MHRGQLPGLSRLAPLLSHQLAMAVEDHAMAIVVEYEPGLLRTAIVKVAMTPALPTEMCGGQQGAPLIGRES